MRSQYVLGLVLLGLTACGGDAPPADDEAAMSMAAPAAPREVRFTATDFAFDGPDVIEAGMITMVLDNQGETWHHLQLVKLPDGMTAQDFQEGVAGMQPGSPPPPWLNEAGGVNPPPAPGEPARVTMLVEPGEYVVLCFVDTPDRVPHVMKGMIRPLTVTEASQPSAPLPESDVTLTLVDYAFSFSAPPTADTKVIRVEVAAEQAHEVVFFRLSEGKTMDDVAAWAQTYEGEPPLTPVGGVPGMRQGQVANVHVRFTPGQYVALCFLPDATDGKLHTEHGMVLPFTIS